MTAGRCEGRPRPLDYRWRHVPSGAQRNSPQALCLGRKQQIPVPFKEYQGAPTFSHFTNRRRALSRARQGRQGPERWGTAASPGSVQASAPPALSSPAPTCARGSSARAPHAQGPPACSFLRVRVEAARCRSNRPVSKRVFLKSNPQGSLGSPVPYFLTRCAFPGGQGRSRGRPAAATSPAGCRVGLPGMSGTFSRAGRRPEGLGAGAGSGGEPGWRNQKPGRRETGFFFKGA